MVWNNHSNNLTTMNYNELIRSSRVVLVEFYAPWCSHCKKMMPVVERVKDSAAADVKVERFDVDRYADLAEQNAISSYPTFIIYRNGTEMWRQSGEMSEMELLAAIESM